MFAMVWDFPVPGGPSMTRLRPRLTASIASCWLESASSTWYEASGPIASRAWPSGAGSRGSDAAAEASPAKRRTSGLAAKASPCTSRSLNMKNLVNEKRPSTIPSIRYARLMGSTAFATAAK